MSAIANYEVAQYLKAAGELRCTVLDHEPRRTAYGRGRALVGAGLASEGETVKTVLLRVGRRRMLHRRSRWALAVLPSGHRIDMRAAALALGEPLRLATEDELRRRYPWCELGCLPALGGLLGVDLLVDPAVCNRRSVVCPAGTPTQSVRIPVRDLMAAAANVQVVLLV